MTPAMEKPQPPLAPVSCLGAASQLRRNKRFLRDAWLLLALAGSLAGCVLPDHYSDWHWKQYNPEWKPLPGDPDR